MGSTRWLLAALAGILLVLTHIAPARAATFRVVVRITSEASRALSERIRGQTSDLPLELLNLDTGPLEPTLAAQVGSATAVAQVYDADAVVWFDDLGRGPTGENRLLVLQPKAKRLLVRGVGESAPSSKRPPSESAELEAAALIVRVAVQAMMQGQVIGVEQARIVGPEPESPRPPPPVVPPPFDAGDAPNALPGVVRVPIAAPFERIGFGAALAGGYAYTESVFGEGDFHQRVFASAAASYRANEWAAFALRLDGRYDWHRHVSTGNGSGWVGEPHLIFRAATPLLGELRGGAEVDVGFPGEQVPSIDFAATSPSLSVFATYAPASPVVFTSLVGFRLDRGHYAITEPKRLTPSQRLSVGASDTNAFLFGLGVAARVTPRWDIVGEWTWDLRVPAKGASALESPMRIDAGARLTPNDSSPLQFQFLVEVSPSARPPIGPEAPLVIVEPRVGAIIGVNLLPSRRN